MRQVSDKVAPLYSQMVKRPMDLLSVRKRIKAGFIRTTAEFHRDILLMLTNAIIYHNGDNKMHMMATQLINEVRCQIEILQEAHAHAASMAENSPENRKRNIKPAVRTRSDTICIERTRKKTENTSTPDSRTVKIDEKSCFVVPAKPQKITKRCSMSQSKKCAAVKTKLERLSVADSSSNDVAKRRKSRANSRVLPNKEQMKMKTERRLSVVVERLPNNNTSEPKRDLEHKFIDIIIDEPNTASKINSNLVIEPQLSQTDLSVAVTTEPQRDLTKDQAHGIKKALEHNILILAMDPNTTFAPRFREKPVIADGVIKLWCEDEMSFKWLRNAVRCIRPPWPDVRLVVIKQCDLPQKIKSALLVPDCSIGIDVIHRLLRIQNPWAEVGSWALYSAEKQGEDMFLVLGIPSTVIPMLMKRERRLNFSLGSLCINFFKGDKLSEIPPGTD